MLIDDYRKLSPAQKLERVQALTRAVQKLTLAGDFLSSGLGFALGTHARGLEAGATEYGGEFFVDLQNPDCIDMEAELLVAVLSLDVLHDHTA